MTSIPDETLDLEAEASFEEQILQAVADIQAEAKSILEDVELGDIENWKPTGNHSQLIRIPTEGVSEPVFIKLSNLAALAHYLCLLRKYGANASAVFESYCVATVDVTLLPDKLLLARVHKHGNYYPENYYALNGQGLIDAGRSGACEYGVVQQNGSGLQLVQHSEA